MRVFRHLGPWLSACLGASLVVLAVPLAAMAAGPTQAPASASAVGPVAVRVPTRHPHLHKPLHHAAHNRHFRLSVGHARSAIGPYARTMHASHSGGAFALAYRPMPSGLRPVPVHAPKALPMPAGVALASAPKPAVHARAPVPVRGAATTLGRPVYDEERYGLVIPYQGQLPLYRWDRRADTAASLEIKGAIATVGRLTQSFSRHPVMSRWQLARNKTAGTVRLDLGFSHPADVVIAADTSRHQLLLIPQPRLAEGVVTSPATATTTLEAARLPMDGRHLFIPFDGPVPAYTLTRVGPTFAYVDFPAGRLASRAVQFFAPEFHPTLAYWLLHERPDHGVRLALALAGDGGAAVYQDRTHQRLVIELGTDGPALGARTAPTLPAPWPGEEREPVLGRK